MPTANVRKDVALFIDLFKAIQLTFEKLFDGPGGC